MFKRIGAFDAKARFSELLRSVGEGESFTISVRGKPVADLVPSRMGEQRDVKETVDALGRLELVKGVSDDEIRNWIRQGRE
ncbi:type II toxin-antitoxin system Phd/YefM family antitoxin [Pseudoduganella sp. R-34]|uniref:type II toxin-antitoxin system Phd/YefM family antitoxin n=1 Tax=unclassified Pseudoduganella TaxID=2637179 RepID=UPI003CF63E57